MEFKIKERRKEYVWRVPEGYEDFVEWMLKRGYKVSSIRSIVLYLMMAIENPRLADEHHSKYVRAKVRNSLRRWSEYLREVRRCGKYLD